MNGKDLRDVFKVMKIRHKATFKAFLQGKLYGFSSQVVETQALKREFLG